jgi:exopolysaccharide biosynthesis polyprenyl glycosylphosphotransferase
MTSELRIGSGLGRPRGGDPDGVATVPEAISWRTSVERAGRQSASPRTRTGWRSAYTRRLAGTDFVAVAVAVFAAQLLWFGTGNADVAMRHDARISAPSYWMFSAVLTAIWMWALSLVDSRSERVIGTGTAEYARVVGASLRVFGAVAIVAFLIQIDVARGYLLVSLPLGVATLLLGRWLWRIWLVRQRAAGQYCAKVLLVGSETTVRQLAHELGRIPSAGYRVVGACVPTGRIAGTIPGTDIPVMGNVDAVHAAVAATGADTVAVTSTDELPASKVKEISWGLEAGRQHLVLAPSIVDIAGPRLHTRPALGLPLIHVETPRFTQGQRLLKRSLDLTASVLGVIALSPLLALLAITIRLSTPGSVLFHQTRVGLGGREFTMLKFRSMVENAEDLVDELAGQERDSGNEVLFKLTNDPRVTPIGRVMRRYSLDELPQLFNVVGGSMSLVGPRPPLPREVELYADHVHRKFLAKPGITGLWQVSGRSSLSWEESVRLDLSYVENWTFAGDLVILLRTGRAALAPGNTAH